MLRINENGTVTACCIGLIEFIGLRAKIYSVGTQYPDIEYFSDGLGNIMTITHCPMCGSKLNQSDT